MAALGVVSLAVLSACAQLSATLPLNSHSWEITEGMDAPESTYIDPNSGRLFVSQIGLRPGGSPVDKDGNGRISLLTPEGQLIKADWVTGLNSPKGLRSHAGVLWVTDVDEVVAIDIATATIRQRIAVPDAKFLNDVAISPEGVVYVSDMVTDKIHQIKAGQVSVLAEGSVLEHPNGLLWENGGLIVAAWGPGANVMKPDGPGNLYRLDLKTRLKTNITTMPAGHLDGLESDGQGAYIVSDWMAGKIWRIQGNGQTQLLKQFKPGTADIAYVPSTQQLIVPHLKDNRVAAYPLRATLASPQP